MTAATLAGRARREFDVDERDVSRPEHAAVDDGEGAGTAGAPEGGEAPPRPAGGTATGDDTSNATGSVNRAADDVGGRTGTIVSIAGLAGSVVLATAQLAAGGSALSLGIAGGLLAVAAAAGLVWARLARHRPATVVLAASVVIGVAMAAGAVVWSVRSDDEPGGGANLEVAAFAVERLEGIDTDFIDFRDDQTYGQTKVPTPVVDITLKNSGNRTAVILGADFTVTSLTEIERCNSGGGPDGASSNYDVALPDPPTALPIRLHKAVRHSIKPGDTDRLTFSIGKQVIISFRQPSWLFRVEVALRTDLSKEPVRTGAALMATPRLQPYFFGLETSEDDPACPTRNLAALDSFLDQSGQASAELTGDRRRMHALAQALRGAATERCTSKTTRVSPRPGNLAGMCVTYSPENFVVRLTFATPSDLDQLLSAGLRLEIRAENQLIQLIGLTRSAEDQTIRPCLYAPADKPPYCADPDTALTLEPAETTDAIEISYAPPFRLVLEGFYRLLISASVFDSRPGDEPDRLPAGADFLTVDLGRP